MITDEQRAELKRRIRNSAGTASAFGVEMGMMGLVPGVEERARAAASAYSDAMNSLYEWIDKEL